ncbi:hypothetical protein NM208_g10410 [Fusarium decemcellulare]|uniref:Uncharacterized protein n=1 Tax=Fusarium decemcellulare TaxID=57161 RepID=A0ACC1RY24_9HYPO|nr:hypothetical protein NM208_g10410 [Fusarium decemcellulare]
MSAPDGRVGPRLGRLNLPDFGDDMIGYRAFGAETAEAPYDLRNGPRDFRIFKTRPWISIMTDQVLRRDSRQGSPSRSQALSDLRRKHRSCVSCYRRKVRCNRTLPCIPCARAGLECTYPSSNRSTSNRPPSLQDVSDRPERLETLLVEALSRDAVEDDRGSGNQALGSGGEVIPEPSIEPAHSRKSCSRPWEALLQAGNRAHYMDNTNLLDLFQDEGRINPPELGKI